MDEDYLEAVLDLVQTIPSGRVMTYGTVAEVVGDRLVADGGRWRGGPRQVGQVLSRAGGGVPWWRVVNAAGGPPASQLSLALATLEREGTPLAAQGMRVDLREALWWPADEASPSLATLPPDDPRPVAEV
ncbi:MGMT family protein [Pengzhenrongella sicca]|uniref:MGMT family protein n=1 Tax=Pengzhenrongella sicca TaxID=2819238 RepID=A0A8A4ZGR5_9MICO|nr:MGMT family protein [Pengzhenrongella sicca]QTE30455.1 MGMT family protein [Pengzhenrongella sicca]